jgi:hypothetical protein
MPAMTGQQPPPEPINCTSTTVRSGKKILNIQNVQWFTGPVPASGFQAYLLVESADDVRGDPEQHKTAQ